MPDGSTPKGSPLDGPVPDGPAPDERASAGRASDAATHIVDGGTTRRARWVAATVCLAGLMMPLSFTGPAVATPAIGRDLGGHPVALAWVVNAFVLSFGSSVMASGALADHLGRKRMFCYGLIGFVILSVVIGLAPSVLALIVLRAVQGVAAALTMSAGAAALAQEFEGPARTRAFGLLGTTFGVGLAFGPIWSGFLIETLGWRSIFLTGAAIGLVTLLAGVPRMRESRDPGAAGLDTPGTVIFTAMLLCLTLGIVQGPQQGWTSALVLFLFAGSAALLVLFLRVERRRARPMLDLSLFRHSRFLGAQLLPIATAFCFVVLLIVLPVRLIGIDGLREMDAGLLMLPLCAPIIVVPLLAALLTRWIPASHLSGLGLVIAAAGLLWLSFVETGPGHAALGGLALPLLVVGVGSGLPWGLMDDLSVSVVPTERAGMAIGIFATMRVAGEAVALTIVGAMLVVLTQSGLRDVGARDVNAGAGAHAATLDPAHVPAVANELASGRLDAAVSLSPQVDRPQLAAVYGEAFQTMLRVLAGVTLASAALAVGLLRRRAAVPAAVATASASVVESRREIVESCAES